MVVVDHKFVGSFMDRKVYGETMKNITASDRKSLIRLASSLPKGDKSRRAILAGLNKTAAKKLTLRLDPSVHQEINGIYKRLKFRTQLAYEDHKYHGLKMTDDFYEEGEQVYQGIPIGFGVMGSILPRLSISSKKAVEEALRSQGIGVADAKQLNRDILDAVETMGYMFWEDPEVALIEWPEGKLVDAVSLEA